MGTRLSRQEKHEWLLNCIRKAKEAGREIDEEKLIKEFCKKFFSTRRTAKEMIGLLND